MNDKGGSNLLPCISDPTKDSVLKLSNINHVRLVDASKHVHKLNADHKPIPLTSLIWEPSSTELNFE